MRYFIFVALILTGCANVDPAVSLHEKDQLAFNKYQAQGPLTTESINNLKQELKQNYHEAIGPSPLYDRTIDATFERWLLKQILYDESWSMDRLILREVAKSPEAKKRVDEMGSKKIAGYIKYSPELSELKKMTVANFKQRIEKLDREIEELQKVVDQEIHLARLRYENKKLQQQRIALGLERFGQALEGVFEEEEGAMEAPALRYLSRM